MQSAIASNQHSNPEPTQPNPGVLKWRVHASTRREQRRVCADSGAEALRAYAGVAVGRRGAGAWEPGVACEWSGAFGAEMAGPGWLTVPLTLARVGRPSPLIAALDVVSSYRGRMR